VRTVAALHGGVDRGTLAGLIEGWRAPQPGLDAAFDAALLRRLTGAVADPAAEAQAVALVDDALVIGALSPRAVSPTRSKPCSAARRCGAKASPAPISSARCGSGSTWVCCPTAAARC
jgi:hypothetical protein